jgi:hypothetical protein
MNLYLDDIRETPNGWHRVYTAKEAIQFLSENWSKVHRVSLDHDLGEDETVVGNGNQVLVWIEEYIATHQPATMPTIVVHSANPAAQTKMQAGIESCYRICTQNWRSHEENRKTPT